MRRHHNNKGYRQIQRGRTREWADRMERKLGLKYEIGEKERQHLAKSFTYHPPRDDQIPRYLEIRGLGKALAETIMESCPPCRERSLALTKCEEAIMWANAAIARNE